MVEVTQEDRDTLDAATAEWQMGDSSVSLEIIAAYRQASYQRGKLEGARLALEAAGRENLMICLTNCEELTDEAMEVLNFAADRIRTLDPAKILGEG